MSDYDFEANLEAELTRELSDMASDYSLSDVAVDEFDEVGYKEPIKYETKKNLLTSEEEVSLGKSHRLAAIAKTQACLKLDTNIELLVDKVSMLANNKMQLRDLVLYVHDFEMLDEEDIAQAPKLWLADKNIDMDIVNRSFGDLFRDYTAYSIAKTNHDFKAMDYHADAFSSIASKLMFSKAFSSEIDSNLSIFKSRLRLNEMKFRDIVVENKVPLKEFLSTPAWLNLDSNKDSLKELIVFFQAHIPTLSSNLLDRISYEFNNLKTVLTTNNTGYKRAKDIFNDYFNAEKEIHTIENKFLEHNKGLLINIAKKYAVDGIGVDELVQGAQEGFIQGIRRWDYRKGYKLSTYVTNYINNAVMLTRESLSDMLKIPAAQKSNIKEIYQASEEFKKRNFKKPSIEDLSNVLEWSTNKVSRVLDQQAKLSNVGSLQFLIGDDAQVQDMVVGSKDVLISSQMNSNENKNYTVLVNGLLSKYEKLAIEHKYQAENYTKSDMDVIRESGGITLDVLDKMATKALTRLEILYKLPKPTIQDIAVINDVVTYALKKDSQIDITSSLIAKSLNVTVASVDQIAALTNELGIGNKIVLRKDFDNSQIKEFVDSVRLGKSYNDEFLQDMGISTNVSIDCDIDTSFVSAFTLKSKTTYLSELDIANKSMSAAISDLSEHAKNELANDASLEASVDNLISLN